MSLLYRNMSCLYTSCEMSTQIPDAAIMKQTNRDWEPARENCADCQVLVLQIRAKLVLQLFLFINHCNYICLFTGHCVSTL